jgi:hypothetical protein
LLWANATAARRFHYAVSEELMIRLWLVVCVAAVLGGCAADRSAKGEGGHDFSAHDFSGASVGVNGAFGRE